MQVLLGLMSPRLWKIVLTLNLSSPLSSLSLSTCSESREADRRGDGGRTGSDISCGKTKEGQASSYLILSTTSTQVQVLCNFYSVLLPALRSRARMKLVGLVSGPARAGAT